LALVIIIISIDTSKGYEIMRWLQWKSSERHDKRKNLASSI